MNNNPIKFRDVYLGLDCCYHPVYVPSNRKKRSKLKQIKVVGQFEKKIILEEFFMSNDKKEIDNKEVNQLSFKIIELLNGLTIGRAIYVLKETKTWLLLSHRVDNSNDDFISILKECCSDSFE